MVDVNILLDEILAVEMKKGKKTEIVHLDSDASIVLGVINFLMRKYPHAVILGPPTKKSIKDVRKSDFRLSWTFREKSGKFELKMHSHLWKKWSVAMSKPEIRFIICFIHLGSTDGGSHANALIYDKHTNELERFDGLGRDLAFAYNWQEMDKEIEALFAQKTDIFPKPVTYFTPLDYCPKMPIFQSKEIDEIPGEDLRGNCAVWRMWYIDVRLANPHLNRKELVELAAKKITNSGSLYRFIKGYQRYVLDSSRSMIPNKAN
jgi:hypothetical protein